MKEKYFKNPHYSTVHYLEATKMNDLIGLNMTSEVYDMLKSTNEKNIPGKWLKEALNAR